MTAIATKPGVCVCGRKAQVRYHTGFGWAYMSYRRRKIDRETRERRGEERTLLPPMPPPPNPERVTRNIGPHKFTSLKRDRRGKHKVLPCDGDAVVGDDAYGYREAYGRVVTITYDLTRYERMPEPRNRHRALAQVLEVYTQGDGATLAECPTDPTSLPPKT